MKCVRTMVLMASLVAATSGCIDEGDEGEDLPELETAEAGSKCKSSNFEVDLNLAVPPIGSVDEGRIFVNLCLPQHGSTPKTVLLLLSGISYSNRYWDLPDPTGGTKRYSFVAAANAAGYATLAIDRIGIGKSTHPISAQIDMPQNVNVARQLVEALRDGDIRSSKGRVEFDKVVLVGHSLGSIMSWLAASDYDEVDGLVLTGATHRLVTAAPVFLAANLYPAPLDPRFATKGLDPGYLTTLPGQRGAMFYAPSTDFDPAVVAQDEATKETLTALEFAGAVAALVTPLDVRVPVFVQMGQLDSIFCSSTPLDGGADCSSGAAVAAQEAPAFGPNVPCVEASVTPGAGHNLNAFFSSQASFAAVISFLNARIGSGSNTPGC